MDFPTTNWSLLAEATLHGDERAGAALADFCARYRKPVIQFLRWKGLREDRLEDLTHDFMVQLITHSSLRRAERAKGTFRSFLCGALQRFLADDVHRNQALKRGGGTQPLSLEGLDETPAQWDDDAGLALDREWALCLVEQVVHETAQEYWAEGNQHRWEVLRNFLPGGGSHADYEASARLLGMSEGALRTEISRLRARFRAQLRRAVAASVSQPEELDAEMRHLHQVLLRAQPAAAPTAVPP